MIDFKRIHRNHEEAGALHSMIAVQSVIHPNVLMTKGGDLLALLRVQGCEFECAMPGELDQICRRIEAAVRAYDENFRVYQYLLKTEWNELQVKPVGHPIVDGLSSNRQQHLNRNGKGLYSIEIYWAICYEGLATVFSKRGGLRNKVSLKRNLAASEQELHRARDLLLDKVRGFVEHLQDVVQIEILDESASVGFLRRLLNYDPEKLAPIPSPHRSAIDFHVCNSTLECHSDHLKLDDFEVRVLTIKELPSQTFPNLLSKLQEIPGNLIVASEWKPESAWNMRKIITTGERHHFNSRTSMASYATGGSSNPSDRIINSAAVAHGNDLGECRKELEVHGRTFGHWSMTSVLYDRDPSRVRSAAHACSEVFSKQGAQLYSETYNLLNAWLAVIPGNHAFNRRKVYLLDVNQADLSFLFAPDVGQKVNEHLNAEYLALLETIQGTPHFLNLHYKDVGHSLVVGSTGSGKSFFLNFILLSLQKYSPVTTIFDIGGSYKKLTEAFGGTYVRVGMDNRAFSINPFSLPKTKENLQFLFSFVKVLVASSGYAMSMEDDQDLWLQIESMYDIDAEHRRLSTLATIVRRPIGQALIKWIGDGQYGWLFDNVKDNLTFATFQAFDFESMDKFPEMLEPLLFYVLHRASEAVNKPENASTLKVFVMDEAWRFFRNPTIKAYILEALKTWRKRNALMILATQSGNDLQKSEMLDVVVESCPTKFFLANPGMDRNVYSRLFHLSEAETDRIAKLISKKQMLLHRPDSSKVLELNVDPHTYELLANHNKTTAGGRSSI